MSSGGATSVTSAAPPQWYSDAAQSYLNQAGQVAQQPYQAYGGPEVAPLSQLQQQALQGMGGVMGGTAGTNAANQFAADTIAGGSVNPFMQQVANPVIRQAEEALGRASAGISARFSGAGNSLMGDRAQLAQSRAMEGFSRGLGDALGGIYNTGFENDQARRFQAANLAQNLQSGQMQNFMTGLQGGNVERQYGQQLMDALRGGFNEARAYPQQQLDIYGNALSRAIGGAGQTQTTQGPGADRVSQGLGIAALGSYLGRPGK